MVAAMGAVAKVGRGHHDNARVVCLSNGQYFFRLVCYDGETESVTPFCEDPSYTYIEARNMGWHKHWNKNLAHSRCPAHGKWIIGQY